MDFEIVPSYLFHYIVSFLKPKHYLKLMSVCKRFGWSLRNEKYYKYIVCCKMLNLECNQNYNSLYSNIDLQTSKFNHELEKGHLGCVNQFRFLSRRNYSIAEKRDYPFVHIRKWMKKNGYGEKCKYCHSNSIVFKEFENFFSDIKYSSCFCLDCGMIFIKY